MKISLEKALEELEAARQIDSEEHVANALFTVAVAYLERDKAEDACEALDEAAHLCRKLDNQPGLSQVSMRLGEVEMLRGNLDAAEDHLRRAWDFFAGVQDDHGRVAAMERLGRVLIQAGRQAEAIPVYEEAAHVCRAAQDGVGEALLTQYLAGLYRALGRGEEALIAYDNLRRAAMALGDRQRVALALVGVGTCLAELDRQAPGLEALQKAADEYLALGQNAQAEQVRAEMERLSGLHGNT